ncbi:MAG: hypothetical protein AAB635_01960 [Patescibacteria group bacterium]
MKKIFLQDVVPSGKRSIRNIPLPNNKSGPATKDAQVNETRTGKNSPKKPSNRPRSNRNFGNLGIWVIALIVIVGLGYAGSFLFVSATVTVIPKEINVAMNLTGTAFLEPAGEELGFTIATLSRESSKIIPASGEEKVERKASGKIIIYNNNGKAAQKLVANTRFETPNGLIFRIQESVLVPGQKTVNSVVIPGSATATIYADQPGEKYNVGLSDFTIPGFKSDSRFTKIIAKSDPKFPIKGGLIGTVKKIAPADAASAKLSIETQLKSELREDLESQIPDSHILFNNALTFNFEELPQDNQNNGMESVARTSTTSLTVVVKEKGSIYGILFDRNALSKYLAERSVEIGQKDVFVSNLDLINFTLENKGAFNPVTASEITFKLAGDTRFVWNIHKDIISEALAGQKRRGVKDILANFESVHKANVAIRPVWVFTLPDKTDRIKVAVGDK